MQKGYRIIFKLSNGGEELETLMFSTKKLAEEYANKNVGCENYGNIKKVLKIISYRIIEVE